MYGNKIMSSQNSGLRHYHYIEHVTCYEKSVICYGSLQSNLVKNTVSYKRKCF